MRPAAVFAYGTLKAGERYAHVAEGAGLTHRVPARAEGLVLYQLPQGYPAAVPGAGRVLGELLYFADLERALKVLDAFEEPPYRRVPLRVEAETGPVWAWVYVYPNAEAALGQGGRRLDAEVWSGAL